MFFIFFTLGPFFITFPKICALLKSAPDPSYAGRLRCHCVAEPAPKREGEKDASFELILGMAEASQFFGF